MIENNQVYSIGMIERDTGIGRDTRRIWERRYGFPESVRNAEGERVYPEIQLRRLQSIRRLLERGLRPGKLLPLSQDALDGLEASLQPAAPELLDETVKEILDAMRSADAWQVESLLRRQYEKQGMQAFILRTVVPLLHRVVDPLHHRQGIGSKLFRVVEEAVRKHGFNRLLLKAQQGSNGFLFHRECNACRPTIPCTSTRTVSGKAQPA